MHEGTHMNLDEMHDDASDIDEEREAQFTEEQLVAMIADQIPWREKVHAQLAIDAVRSAKLFTGNTSDWNVRQQDEISIATKTHLEQLKKWNVQMKNDVLILNNLLEAGMDKTPEMNGARVDMLRELGTMEPGMTNNVNEAPVGEAGSEAALTALKIKELKTDQRRAFDIITWHVKQMLAGKNPPPLRMILYGEGGTGKSKVIQSVTAEMEHLRAGSLLLKSAYTGVAASLIDGKTTTV
jgi:hypothetical protein